MKNNIIIFGDSYGDPEIFSSSNKFKNTNAWYDLLKYNYNIINHSVSGSGPHYSFKKYYEFISKEQKLNDYICIFLLSGPDRINFYSRHPSSGTHIFWDNRNKKSHLIDEKDKVFYNNFKSEIDFFYLTMQDEINWFNCKNISFLYTNSILLGLKTIVFLTSSSYDMIAENERFIDYKKLNNSNFFIYPTILSNISEMEFNNIEKIKEKNKSCMNYAFKDFRRNHFSQENHEVFYKNIEKIIVNDYKLDAFKKHLNSYDYYGEIDYAKPVEFIYE